MKNTMKKTTAFFLSAALCLAMAAGATEVKAADFEPQDYGLSYNCFDYLSGDYPEIPADGPEYALTIAHCTGETTDANKMLTDLKNALETYSNGKITVAIYPNGQLGSDAEIIASCVHGDIDFVYQSGSTHASFVPEATIFDTPFLFTGYDFDKIDKVMADSEFRDLYNEANDEAGFACLMLKVCGFMALTSNRPVTSLEELKGLKIRTAQAETRMAVWDALGANPTPLAFSELYMALQNGTVDAQDNLLVTPIISKVAEVQKYLIPTEHIVASMELVMNKGKLESMPEEYQELIRKVCKELEPMDARTDHEKDQSYYDQLVNEYGLEVCEISDEFAEQLKTGAEPAIDTVKKIVDNDALYEALDKALNE